jgi:hypothetical protein
MTKETEGQGGPVLVTDLPAVIALKREAALRTKVNVLVEAQMGMTEQDAQEAGALGFMARSLTLASLPHSRVEGTEFKRRNGAYTLSIMAPSDVGLPYGTVPRLLLAWLTTEAVRTRDRNLVLGDNLSAFMRALDLAPNGGRWGNIMRLREQTTRLFASSFTAIWKGKDRTALAGHRVVDAADLWWDPKHPKQESLWQSTVRLGEPFFNEIIERPVPIDMRALKALRKSPMALDIYTWLTYRMSYVTKPTTVSWADLQGQFGAGYPQTPVGLRSFRGKFLRALRSVVVVYGGAKAQDSPAGLTLSPGRPHILKAPGG